MKPASNKDFYDRMMQWIGSVPSLILHTAFFVLAFASVWLGASLEKVLLIVTTLVSLEAIYLAIFIQMAVNRASESLAEVEDDIDEIQEDVGEIEKDIDEIQEDIDEIEKDDQEDESRDFQNKKVLDKIETQLQSLIKEIEKIKKSG